jgi:hypothetical protein
MQSRHLFVLAFASVYSVQSLAPPGFESLLRCPYSKVWLEHGAEKAARMLGISGDEAEHVRRLQWPGAGASTNGSWPGAGAGNSSNSSNVSYGGPPSGAAGGWGGFSGFVPNCIIAPGPMGAAHQMAQSAGYNNSCPGTPAQGSPYMWPLRWTALSSVTTLKAGSDEPQSKTSGRVWYMLDKNWKRLDIYSQMGVERGLGQVPCANPEVNSTFGCMRNNSNRLTMLHRGNQMFFISWSNSSDTGVMTNCTWTDLQIIGNVRPDWFMDDRGQQTDVQYLGDQHIFYQGAPRLVKQWRKMDFSNSYFVMSMQRIPGIDGVHWPLIMNYPGEGFGDDGVQVYSNHSLLNESDSSLFMLDQAFTAAGGTCVQLGSAGGGPPTGQVAPIPTNLEVEKVSWVKVVHTESPIWTPPAATSSQNTASTGVKTLDGGHTIQVCYDTGLSTLRVVANFSSVDPAWVALGFMQYTETCAMNAAGSVDREVVLATPSEDGSDFQTTFGLLPASIRSMVSSNKALKNAVPVSDSKSFSGSSASFMDGRIKLAFNRLQPQSSNLQLTYAAGGSIALDYHQSRGCVKFDSVPPCPSFTCPACPTCKFNLNPTSFGPQVVIGSMMMNVSDAQSLANDTNAQDAIASAIAGHLGVPTSYVTVAVSLVGSSSRRLQLSSTVKVDYTITVPASDTSISAQALVQTIAQAAPAAIGARIVNAFANSGIPYSKYQLTVASVLPATVFTTTTTTSTTIAQPPTTSKNTTAAVTTSFAIQAQSATIVAMLAFFLN